MRRAEELETLWLCVAPLWLGGLRGKKSNPSVGWEVPVSSLKPASRSGSGRSKESASTQGKGMFLN